MNRLVPALAISMLGVLMVTSSVLSQGGPPSDRPGQGGGPPIEWDPANLSVEAIEQGQELQTSAAFRSRQNFDSLDVWVVPALTNDVLVESDIEVIQDVEEGVWIDLELTITVSDDAEVGAYDGTLHLRDGNRTVARPLPIEINVEESDDELEGILRDTDQLVPGYFTEYDNGLLVGASPEFTFDEEIELDLEFADPIESGMLPENDPRINQTGQAVKLSVRGEEPTGVSSEGDEAIVAGLPVPDGFDDSSIVALVQVADHWVPRVGMYDPDYELYILTLPALVSVDATTRIVLVDHAEYETKETEPFVEPILDFWTGEGENAEDHSSQSMSLMSSGPDINFRVYCYASDCSGQSVVQSAVDESWEVFRELDEVQAPRLNRTPWSMFPGVTPQYEYYLYDDDTAFLAPGGPAMGLGPIDDFISRYGGQDCTDVPGFYFPFTVNLAVTCVLEDDSGELDEDFMTHITAHEMVHAIQWGYQPEVDTDITGGLENLGGFNFPNYRIIEPTAGLLQDFHALDESSWESARVDRPYPELVDAPFMIPDVSWDLDTWNPDSMDYDLAHFFYDLFERSDELDTYQRIGLLFDIGIKDFALHQFINQHTEYENMREPHWNWIRNLAFVRDIVQEHQETATGELQVEESDPESSSFSGDPTVRITQHQEIWVVPDELNPPQYIEEGERVLRLTNLSGARQRLLMFRDVSGSGQDPEYVLSMTKTVEPDVNREVEIEFEPGRYLFQLSDRCEVNHDAFAADEADWPGPIELESGEPHTVTVDVDWEDPLETRMVSIELPEIEDAVRYNVDVVSGAHRVEVFKELRDRMWSVGGSSCTEPMWYPVRTFNDVTDYDFAVRTHAPAENRQVYLLMQPALTDGEVSSTEVELEITPEDSTSLLDVETVETVHGADFVYDVFVDARSDLNGVLARVVALGLDGERISEEDFTIDYHEYHETDGIIHRAGQENVSGQILLHADHIVVGQVRVEIWDVEGEHLMFSKTADVQKADDQVTLTVLEPEGEGTMTIEPGEYQDEPGQVIEISAMPDEGWGFSHWTVNDEVVPQEELSNHTLLSLELDSDTTVQAVFEQLQ